MYEAYVDLAIDRYLGYDLGTMVPAARQALVDVLIESGGDVRAVDRAVLTSSVYAAAGQYDEDVKPNPEDWDPPYWHGPVKQMDAETWLSSAQRLVGIDPGSCDHRYPRSSRGPAASTRTLPDDGRHHSGLRVPRPGTTAGRLPRPEFRRSARRGPDWSLR